MSHYSGTVISASGLIADLRGFLCFGFGIGTRGFREAVFRSFFVLVVDFPVSQAGPLFYLLEVWETLISSCIFWKDWVLSLSASLSSAELRFQENNF
ncbi:hypothetical protein EVAR_54302_1 [Eumeta japonica]|uniref:Uncharacterized protein n=1 Tax=Eumeta variegata TaxID=151549 RepID=A0A4C1Z223_EUMVA|nr:hypothetical protein EVAR_54302_1 [Eumeta japonica]